MTTHAAGAGLAALALMLNAFTWGVSWWPLRQLQQQGLHPLWATVFIYALALVVITLWRPRAWLQLLRTPALWLLMLAAGTTNASFNWAVTLGDVVRVVLLFYLMPLWAVLLARLLLGERIRPAALLRVALALAGAAVVLWPADAPAGSLLAALPLPRALPDWLGLLGGFSFALNNVLLRREAGRAPEGRGLAMFLGGMLISLLLAVALAGPAGAPGAVPPPPAPAAGWLAGALAMALAFLGGNLALQYGAARLPANVTAVVMLSEVPFAAGSAVLLGGGTLSPTLLLGGALIVCATLLAARGGDG